MREFTALREYLRQKGVNSLSPSFNSPSAASCFFAEARISPCSPVARINFLYTSLTFPRRISEGMKSLSEAALGTR